MDVLRTAEGAAAPARAARSGPVPSGVDRSFRRYSPEFADRTTEAAFRQWEHRAALRYARIVALVVMVAVLAFSAVDFLQQQGMLLLASIGIRLTFAAAGLALVVAIGRGIGPQMLDRCMFLWVLALLSSSMSLEALREQGFAMHAMVHQMTIGSVYLLFPLRHSQRLMAGIGGGVAYFAMMVALRPLGPAGIVALALVVTVANAFGAVISFRLERLRRLDFRRLEEAKESAERLAESESNLLRVFDTTPVPMSLSDLADGTPFRVNRAMVDLLRIDPDHPTAYRAMDHYADPADRYELVQRVQRDGCVDGYEVAGRARDGTKLWVAVSARRIDYHGRPSLLACWYDISRRKAEEDALRDAKQAAEEASAAKSRFLAVISHELRTPMNGVLGLIQLVGNGRLDRAQERHLRMAQESGEALIGLLDQILDYVRLEREAPLSTMEFELHDVAETAIALLRGAAKAKDLALTLRVDAKRPMPLAGDAARLRQVLVNLAGNAIKFTERGSVTVDLAVRPAATGGVELDLIVADTGIGIAPEMQARVFDEFVQADATIGRHAGGTGLGLAVCQKIVALMGGEISLASQVGHGSLFRVRLPFARGGGAVQAAVTATPPEERLSVLLVEDDPVNQRVAEGLLHASGHEVATVGRGEDALAAAAARDFDLIITDLHMPGMHGLEIIRRVRALADPARAGVPILVLTADVTEESRRSSIEAGADALLAKPVLRRTLDRALADLCGGIVRRAGEQPSRRPADADATALIDHDYVEEQRAALGAAQFSAHAALFRRTSRATLGEIEDAMRRRDRREVERLAHRLCSSAGALGLVQLSSLARRIETGAADDRGDAAAATTGLAALRVRSLLALRAALRGLVDRDAELVADIGDRRDHRAVG